MGLLLNGSADALSLASAPATVTPLTIAGWFNTDTIAANGTICSLCDVSLSNTYYSCAAQGSDAGDPVGAIARNSSFNRTARSSTGFTAGSWFHAAAVFASTTSRDAYIDAGSKGSNALSTVISGIDVVGVGYLNRASPAGWFDGTLAEVGIWDVALSAADLALLAAYSRCDEVQPGNLVFYAPLRTTPWKDQISGSTLTTVGSPTVGAHPPVVYETALHDVMHTVMGDVMSDARSAHREYQE